VNKKIAVALIQILIIFQFNFIFCQTAINYKIKINEIKLIKPTIIAQGQTKNEKNILLISNPEFNKYKSIIVYRRTLESNYIKTDSIAELKSSINSFFIDNQSSIDSTIQYFVCGKLPCNIKSENGWVEKELNLMGKQISSNKIQLNWNQLNKNFLKSYSIFKGIKMDNLEKVITTKDTSYTDTINYSTNINLYYRIVANFHDLQTTDSTYFQSNLKKINYQLKTTVTDNQFEDKIMIYKKLDNYELKIATKKCNLFEKLIIVNISGNVLYEGNNIDHHITLPKLQRGIYILYLEGNIRWSKKILIF
jgi:hypothetical protein